ncbi:MAG: IS110 family transposase, partial [Gemmatimonadales bacterium]
LTVGLDLSDRDSHYAVVDRSGELVEEQRVRTTSSALQRAFSKQDRMRIVLEVGTHSPWVSRLLISLGHEVLVANARKLRWIYKSDHKTDRLDARNLARVGRLDPQLLCPIRHRGEQAQADLGVLRARDALVRARVRLVNHVRGAVKAVGGRLPSCSIPAFVGRTRLHIPESLQPALVPVLDGIEHLTGQIRQYDHRIEELSRERYPETLLLRAVPGVGPLTALCYVLTLEEPHRFARSRSVGPYLGLCSRQWQSGMQQSQLRITKAGDAMLRRLLVSAANYIVGPFGPDTSLRRWGEQLVARGGRHAKQQAVVAVARKLACLLHSMWVHERAYDSENVSVAA